eukprot:7376457-Prymnesium_polylepis.1
MITSAEWNVRICSRNEVCAEAEKMRTGCERPVAKTAGIAPQHDDRRARIAAAERAGRHHPANVRPPARDGRSLVRAKVGDRTRCEVDVAAAHNDVVGGRQNTVLDQPCARRWTTKQDRVHALWSPQAAGARLLLDERPDGVSPRPAALRTVRAVRALVEHQRRHWARQLAVERGDEKVAVAHQEVRWVGAVEVFAIAAGCERVAGRQVRVPKRLQQFDRQQPGPQDARDEGATEVGDGSNCRGGDVGDEQPVAGRQADVLKVADLEAGAPVKRRRSKRGEVGAAHPRQVCIPRFEVQLQWLRAACRTHRVRGDHHERRRSHRARRTMTGQESERGEQGGGASDGDRLRNRRHAAALGTNGHAESEK